MNTSKWLPKQHHEVVKLFEQTRALEREFRVLGKKFATDINLDLPDYYVSMVEGKSGGAPAMAQCKISILGVA